MNAANFQGRLFLPLRKGSTQDRWNRLRHPFATRLPGPSCALWAAWEILGHRPVWTMLSLNCRGALERVSSQFLSGHPKSAHES